MKDLILVCGCPRSGTTAVARSIARHTPYFTNESGLFFHWAKSCNLSHIANAVKLHMKNTYKIDYSPDYIKNFNADKTGHSFNEASQMYITEAYSLIGEYNKRKKYFGIRDKDKDAKTKIVNKQSFEYDNFEVWGDKFPPYATAMNRINGIFSPKWIFVMRNPYNTAASLLRLEWSKSQEDALLCWLEYTNAYEEFDGNKTMVFQEKLQDESELSKIESVTGLKDINTTEFIKKGDTTLHDDYYKNYINESRIPSAVRDKAEKYGYIF